MSHFEVFVFKYINFICSTSCSILNIIIFSLSLGTLSALRHGTRSLLHLCATTNEHILNLKLACQQIILAASSLKGKPQLYIYMAVTACLSHKACTCSQLLKSFLAMRQFISRPQNMATKQFCTILFFISRVQC